MTPLTPEGFDRIVRFILQRGDRQTYCNMHNLNPHFEFEGFHAYLHPDAGQRNINCDPSLSGFDALVIQHTADGWEYFKLQRLGKSVACEKGSEPFIERMLARIALS